MARTKDFDEKEVLDKAICLFWHKGYNGTSMQDLVDKLGISRSSLYDTFGDKHDLYLQALSNYQELGAKKLIAIATSSKTALQSVRRLLEQITADMLGDQDNKGCFMVNANVETANHDPEVMKVITRNEKMIEDVFYKEIKRGFDTGEFKSGQDPRALARYISNTIRGIQVSSKSVKDRRVFNDIVETTLSVFR